MGGIGGLAGDCSILMYEVGRSVSGMGRFGAGLGRRTGELTSHNRRFRLNFKNGAGFAQDLLPTTPTGFPLTTGIERGCSRVKGRDRNGWAEPDSADTPTGF